MDDGGIGLNGQSVKRVEKGAIGGKVAYLGAGMQQPFQEKVFIRERFGPGFDRRLEQLVWASCAGVKKLESGRCMSLRPYLGGDNV